MKRVPDGNSLEVPHRQGLEYHASDGSGNTLWQRPSRRLSQRCVKHSVQSAISVRSYSVSDLKSRGEGVQPLSVLDQKRWGSAKTGTGEGDEIERNQ